MFCAKCGVPIADDAQFCSRCGAPTNATVLATGNQAPFLWLLVLGALIGLILFFETGNLSFRLGVALGQVIGSLVLAVPVLLLGWAVFVRNKRRPWVWSNWLNALSVITAVVWFVLFVLVRNFFLPSLAFSAPHETVLKCSLVYGSLFMSSRKAGDSNLLAYSQDRIRAIAPEIQSYRGNAAIEQDYKRIAQQNRSLIERLERDFYDAIVARDNEKFRVALREVLACDRQLGIRESRIPSL